MSGGPGALDRLMRASAQRPGTVLALAAAAAAAGAFAWAGLPHDVLPALSDGRITLIGEWMGHAADEVDAEATLPLVSALQGVPGVRAVRSQSMPGMAVVELLPVGSSDEAALRATLEERLAGARGRLPPGAHWVLGSGADATGWVLQYALVDRWRRHDRAALTRLQRERVAPALAALPGVAEVATVGGQDDELRVEADPARLAAARLTLEELATRMRGKLPSRISELASLPIGRDRLGDLAIVRRTPRMGAGFADLDGVLDAVGGVVVARQGADVRLVLRETARALATARTTLPSGIELQVVYDRGDVLEAMDRTLRRALLEEVAIVALVVLAFLRQRRAALVPMLTLPLVLLAAGVGLRLAGVGATVVSLAGLAIALGLAVDAEIVMLEAGERRLLELPTAARPDERRRATADAARRVATPLVVTLLVTAAAFLPALGFAGETGRLLAPLVLGKTFVVLAAAVVTVTVAPALRAAILPAGPARAPGRLPRAIEAAYRPFLHVALRSPRLSLAMGALAVLSCLPLLWRAGGEFLPAIDEGTLLYMPTTGADVPPHEAQDALRAIDAVLTRQPGVASAFGKVGRAESATDPASYAMAEVTIRLRPPEQRPSVLQRRWWTGWLPPLAVLRRVWPDRRPAGAAEMIALLDGALSVPGWTNGWTQPIRGRIDMVATGSQAPVVARIQAASPERLDELGRSLVTFLRRLPGTRNVVYEPSGGGLDWTLASDAAALGRHGLSVEALRRAVRVARDGIDVGTMTPEAVPVVVGYPAGYPRLDIALAALPVGDGSVTLGEVARPVLVDAPLLVQREDGRRVGYVYVALESDRDPVGYVEDARRALPAPTAGSLTWIGQYRLAQAARARLLLIFPASIVVVFALLWWQLRRIAEVLIVFASVPFALVGSVWALHLLGYRFSAAVAVGMLSLVGLAAQTGVMMVMYMDAAFFRRLHRGRVRSAEDVRAAHTEGTVARARPKAMTLVAMSASLAPLIWAQGPGAEIVKRIAAPMLGGLVSSAFLTLELIPVLLTMWRIRQLAVASRRGVPLGEVVGIAPPWEDP